MNWRYVHGFESQLVNVIGILPSVWHFFQIVFSNVSSLVSGCGLKANNFMQIGGNIGLDEGITFRIVCKHQESFVKILNG